MKKSVFLLIFIGYFTFQYCSEDFLDVEINGYLSDDVLATDEGIDALLTGAYSMLDGVTEGNVLWETSSSGWLYGDVRGMIANRGSDAGDNSDMHPIANYNETPTNSWLLNKWRNIYESINRCNNTIRVINLGVRNGTVNIENADLYLKQARALRGWYHFDAWRMWEKIPYVDERIESNNATNKFDYRDKIIADLRAGTSLPDNMGLVGRFNSTVCKVLLAKAQMQMYHNYDSALFLLADVKSNGLAPDGSPIGLAATYGEIFDIENRNGIESVYTVQYSVNDGSGGLNGGAGEVLNFPYSPNSPAGCCGFFQPNSEYVNSFRTHDGLPLLDFSYNDDPVKSDYEVDSDSAFIEDDGPLDPRLDWSVGRRGIPYWDWGEHPGMDWIRDQYMGGPYSPKKQVYKKSQEGIYTENGTWTHGFTANGYRMIRYADILLLLAECQIETGDLDGALENINLVRARAANPDGFVKETDGITPAANYQISEYPAFPNQDYARKALYMERKLELGMEGHRWFDLNRWGSTVTELNRALEYEYSLPSGLTRYGATSVGPEDVTYPIPQTEIDLSNGNLVQNRVIPED